MSAGRWSPREIGHLRMVIERYQSQSVHEMARHAHETIKKRSLTAIGHKLRELITEQEFKDDEIWLEGYRFPAEVISGYIVITLVDGSKKPAHIWLWEYAYGPVPHGYHVHHIDGRRTNNSLNNLQLLSAVDHVRLHMSPGAMPPETAALFWFLQGRGLWEAYLTFRDEILNDFPQPDGK